MIQLLVKLRELGTLSHDGLAHEERSLYGLIAPLVHKLQCTVDECLVEQHASTLEEVPTPPCHLGAIVEVRNVEQLNKIHMVVLVACQLLTRAYCLHYRVVILYQHTPRQFPQAPCRAVLSIPHLGVCCGVRKLRGIHCHTRNVGGWRLHLVIVNRHRVVHKIADWCDGLVTLAHYALLLNLCCCQLLLQSSSLCLQICGILLSLQHSSALFRGVCGACKSSKYSLTHQQQLNSLELVSQSFI